MPGDDCLHIRGGCRLFGSGVPEQAAPGRSAASITLKSGKHENTGMTQTAPYDGTGQVGDIELRTYPVLMLATVSGTSEDAMFMTLFRYIGGNNRASAKIPMTAPVITGTRIPMTSPVISGSGSMSFVMPQHYTKTTVPEPLDPAITIREVPARTLAVLRFSGTAGEEAVKERTRHLLSVLEKEKIATTSAPFLMRYNSPWTPGFLRRNEVGVEIVSK
jgi:hypothetical protein